LSTKALVIFVDMSSSEKTKTTMTTMTVFPSALTKEWLQGATPLLLLLSLVGVDFY
jgi:hypothetical protein